MTDEMLYFKASERRVFELAIAELLPGSSREIPSPEVEKQFFSNKIFVYCKNNSVMAIMSV